MLHLKDVSFKARARFIQQLGRQGKVALGAREIDVAEIGGELGQQQLQIRAAAIPGD
ncbi:hypothetical protein PTKU46_79800 [Paraburkholderia terrae]